MHVNLNWFILTDNYLQKFYVAGGIYEIPGNENKWVRCVLAFGYSLIVKEPHFVVHPFVSVRRNSFSVPLMGPVRKVTTSPNQLTYQQTTSESSPFGSRLQNTEPNFECCASILLNQWSLHSGS